MASCSTTLSRPPPVKAEHGSAPPFLDKPEPQELALANNPPSQTSQKNQCLPQPQPNVINSVNELRGLSSALSAFHRRYDELQQHLDFIRTSLDAQLLQHLDADHSPPQPIAIVPLSKTLTSDNTAVGESAKSEDAAEKNHSSLSEIESLCLSMCSRSFRKYMTTHLSDRARLREEVPAALKMAPNSARLVLESFGRFFLQGIKAYNKDSPMILGRQVSILILECFLLMGLNNDEIEAAVKEEAESAAVAWRKRLISEGGLAKAGVIDARGLLLLVGCFGIPSALRNEDIRDLIRSSNAREISDVLRRSDVLLSRIPEIIEEMTKNKMEVEAIDIVYIFGMESRFPPEKILQSFLQESNDTWKKRTKAAQGSLTAVNETNKKQLSNLKLVMKCLEAYKLDPLKILPGWQISEMISSLEQDITELNKKTREQAIANKRRADELDSSKNKKSEEVKRTRFASHDSQEQLVSPCADGKGFPEGLAPTNLLDGGIPGFFNRFPASSSKIKGGEQLPPGYYGWAPVSEVMSTKSQPYRWREDVYLSERLIGQSFAEPVASEVTGLFRSALPLEGRFGEPAACEATGLFRPALPVEGRFGKLAAREASGLFRPPPLEGSFAEPAGREVNGLFRLAPPLESSFAEPAARGVNGLFRPAPPAEGFVGLTTRSSIVVPHRSSASDLYQFADAIL